jgi:hypothetical protein
MTAAIQPDTRRVLIVTEALHDPAPTDVDTLRNDPARALKQHWQPATGCISQVSVDIPPEDVEVRPS